MEGRRVSRQAKKYNPLFILFLCLATAVLVLLIISIALGIRLKGANKKLAASEKEVRELTQSVGDLEAQVSAAEKRIASLTAPKTDAPSGETDPQAGGAATNSSWLDLSGHSEVDITPTNLLDAYAAYYTTAGVNLRSGPATSYTRITTVDAGAKVDVAARDGNWSFARVGNKFGWINSDFLSTTQPSQRTSGTTGGSRSEATSGSVRR